MYLGAFAPGALDSRIAQSPQVALLVPVLALHAGQAAHEWLGWRKTQALRVGLAIVYLFLLSVVDRGEGSPFLYFQF
jgi:hypothetical protein